MHKTHLEFFMCQNSHHGKQFLRLSDKQQATVTEKSSIVRVPSLSLSLSQCVGSLS